METRSLGRPLLPFVALAVACAPAAPAQPAGAPASPRFLSETTPAAPLSQVPEAKRGGIVVYAQQAAMQTLHPWKGDVTIARAMSGVYEPLLRMDHRENYDFRREKEIKPGLAERWEVVNPQTFLFHLRKNAKWHDGKPVTADDVVWSMQMWTDAKEAPEPRQSAGGLIASVEKVDDYTVRATTRIPSANFLRFLAMNRNPYIAPKHVEDLSKAGIGSGPFKVVKADIRTVIAVERFPDFYLAGRPYLDGAKVFLGMERGAQQAAFIAKGLDIANVGDQAQFDALKKQLPEGVKSTSYLQDHGISLYMKLDKPPFNDIRVRKAIHLAIDRDGLVKTVTFGAGAINPPGGLALSSGAIPLEELRKLPGWRQPKDEDIAEAKRLLAEAGYPNGFKTTVITARDRTTAVPVLEATAPMLRAIGIEAEVGLLERAVFLTRQRDGDYDAQMDLIHSDPPTERLLTYYHSKGSLNKAPINDPELDKLIDAIDSELDPKKADEILLRIQRMVLDKHYTIPTVELPSFAFWQPWLNNYNLSFSAQPYIPQWDNLWLDPEKGYPSDRTLER